MKIILSRVPLIFTRCCGMLLLAALFNAGNAFAENGITKNEILLGQTTALTGPLAVLGKDTSAGANAYFAYINSQGGINGRKIKLLTLDDGYNTVRGVANAKKLVEEENVFALFNNISTPTNLALVPLLEKYGVPNFAPYTGAESIRTPFNRLVFHVRAGYKNEIEKTIDQFNIRGISRVAVVYQNNAFGKGGLANVSESLKKTSTTLVGSAPLEADSSNVLKATQTIYSVMPQAILLISAGKSTVDFVKAYNQLGVGTQYCMLSVMGTQETVRSLGKDSSGTIVSQVMPFPFSATSLVVMKYQKIMKQAGISDFSFVSMEGFISAMVITEGLKRAGKNPTRESFIQGLETLRDYDFGDYYVTFTPSNHEGSRYVELTGMTQNGGFIR